jgi:hypothetical protein
MCLSVAESVDAATLYDADDDVTIETVYEELAHQPTPRSFSIMDYVNNTSRASAKPRRTKQQSDAPRAATQNQYAKVFGSNAGAFVTQAADVKQSDVTQANGDSDSGVSSSASKLNENGDVTTRSSKTSQAHSSDDDSGVESGLKSVVGLSANSATATVSEYPPLVVSSTANHSGVTTRDSKLAPAISVPYSHADTAAASTGGAATASAGNANADGASTTTQYNNNNDLSITATQDNKNTGIQGAVPCTCSVLRKDFNFNSLQRTFRRSRTPGQGQGAKPSTPVIQFVKNCPLTARFHVNALCQLLGFQPVVVAGQPVVTKTNEKTGDGNSNVDSGEGDRERGAKQQQHKDSNNDVSLGDAVANDVKKTKHRHEGGKGMGLRQSLRKVNDVKKTHAFGSRVDVRKVYPGKENFSDLRLDARASNKNNDAPASDVKTGDEVRSSVHMKATALSDESGNKNSYKNSGINKMTALKTTDTTTHAAGLTRKTGSKFSLGAKKSEEGVERSDEKAAKGQREKTMAGASNKGVQDDSWFVVCRSAKQVSPWDTNHQTLPRNDAVLVR